MDFDTLLAQSDVLSLHCPLSDRTRGLIDLAAMKKMKSSAILINVARGPVVKEADLCTALKEKLIAGAGLDVLEKEPMVSDSPLLEFQDSSQLLITPHMAWATVRARQNIINLTAENILRWKGGTPINVVNAVKG